jgi:hypothetical protein
MNKTLGWLILLLGGAAYGLDFPRVWPTPLTVGIA